MTKIINGLVDKYPGLWSCQKIVTTPTPTPTAEIFKVRLRLQLQLRARRVQIIFKIFCQIKIFRNWRRNILDITINK